MTATPKQLRCPRDETVLAETPGNGGRTHACKHCRGTFVDVDKVAGLRAQANCNRNVRRPVGQMHIFCPHDQSRLVPFNFKNVEVDVCFTCFGAWLDAGELEKVGKISSPGPAIAPGQERKGGWFDPPEEKNEALFTEHDDGSIEYHPWNIFGFVLNAISAAAENK
jgi:Zn-finger nucleic acid-binding protein